MKHSRRWFIFRKVQARVLCQHLCSYSMFCLVFFPLSLLSLNEQLCQEGRNLTDKQSSRNQNPHQISYLSLLLSAIFFHTVINVVVIFGKNSVLSVGAFLQLQTYFCNMWEECSCAAMTEMSANRLLYPCRTNCPSDLVNRQFIVMKCRRLQGEKMGGTKR